MAIIGIDLGTTNSLVGVWRDGESVLIPNAFGDVLTPSAVSVEEDGSIVVGKIARDRLISHPACSAASFKLAMGTGRVFDLGGKRFRPEELSSFVLRRLRDDAEAFLGAPVEEAIISVPAYFNDKQRSATKLAGQLAGLRVERLINEPSAAALAGRVGGGEEEGTYLVCDFGGGTLDISVVDCFEDVVEIVAVSGDNHLGGDDFDRVIAEHLCWENGVEFSKLPHGTQAVLREQAHRCKHALDTQKTCLLTFEEDGRTLSAVMTSETLIRLSVELLTRLSDAVGRALFDSRRVLRDIDRVLLVGGSCKMPVVQKFLAHRLQKQVALTHAPDEMVARGVSVYAGIKERDGDIRDVLLTDICPFTLGTGVINYNDPNRSLMSPVIERNSTLPTSKIKQFYTASDRQDRMVFDIYQGEALYCEDNLKIGSVTIPVPPGPKGRESADVRFTYDINGILEVELQSTSTGQKVRKLIIGEDGRMTEEELARRLEELSTLKRAPHDAEGVRMTLARAERLFAQTMGQTRQEIFERLTAFQQELARQERLEIRRHQRQFDAFLDMVEADVYTFGEFWDMGNE